MLSYCSAAYGDNERGLLHALPAIENTSMMIPSARCWRTPRGSRFRNLNLGFGIALMRTVVADTSADALFWSSPGHAPYTTANENREHKSKQDKREVTHFHRPPYPR
jgi:hypothetical protein